MITAKIKVPVHELVNALIVANPGMKPRQAKEYIFKNLVLAHGDYVELEIAFEKPL